MGLLNLTNVRIVEEYLRTHIFPFFLTLKVINNILKWLKSKVSKIFFDLDVVENVDYNTIIKIP